MPAINPTDLINAKTDADTIAEVATSRVDGSGSGAVITETTTRLGETTKTLKGQLELIGLEITEPVPAWPASTSITQQNKVYRSPAGDLIYPAETVPFTTGASFDAAEASRWYAAQMYGVGQFNASAPAGSFQVDNSGDFLTTYTHFVTGTGSAAFPTAQTAPTNHDYNGLGMHFDAANGRALLIAYQGGVAYRELDIQASTFVISTGPAATVEALKIDGGGNAFLATTAGQSLTVGARTDTNFTGSSNGLFIRQSTSPYHIAYTDGGVQGILGGTSGRPFFGSYNAAGMNLRTNNADRITIDATGILGLNVTPATTAHIKHPSAAGTYFRIEEGSSSYKYEIAVESGEGNALLIRDANVNGIRWKITTAGDLLPGVTETFDIGSTSLEVDNIYVQNAPTVSDRDRKRDIRPIPYATALLDEIEGVEFKLNDVTIQPKTVIRKVPKTQTKTRESSRVEMRDGKAVQVAFTEEYEEPVFEEFFVEDENGNAVFETIKVGETEDGNPIFDQRRKVHREPVLVEEEFVLTEGFEKTHGRPHTGVIAQDVKAAMDKVGVDDWAGYQYDPETGRHLIRYQEFIGLILSDRKTMKAEIAALKEAVSNG